MQPVAIDIDAATSASGVAALLRRHCGRHCAPPDLPEAPPPSRADALLAEQGDAGARIPACAGCHGADALKTYPRLAGQNAAYMATGCASGKAASRPAPTARQ